MSGPNSSPIARGNCRSRSCRYIPWHLALSAHKDDPLQYSSLIVCSMCTFGTLASERQVPFAKILLGCAEGTRDNLDTGCQCASCRWALEFAGDKQLACRSPPKATAALSRDSNGRSAVASSGAPSMTCIAEEVAHLSVCVQSSLGSLISLVTLGCTRNISGCTKDARQAVLSFALFRHACSSCWPLAHRHSVTAG